jgi:hypothetical protein
MNCLHCGKQLDYMMGRPPRFCSKACNYEHVHKPVRDRNCLRCGAPFVSRHGRALCSDDCRREYKRECEYQRKRAPEYRRKANEQRSSRSERRTAVIEALRELGWVEGFKIVGQG